MGSPMRMPMLFALPLAQFLVACGPDLEAPPEPGPAVAMSAAATVQSAEVGARVSVAATVTDAAGLAVAGQVINFVPVPVYPGSDQGTGSVHAGSAISTAAGVAREIWTLGTRAGEQVLEARAVNQVTGDPIVVRIAVHARPGPTVSHRVLPEGVSVHTNGAPAGSWDWSALTVWAQDRHDNRTAANVAPLPLIDVRFSGRTYGGAREPTCSVAGTVLTCERTVTNYVGWTSYVYGVFVARFDARPFFADPISITVNVQ